jgi:two-component system, cell cycle response regulator
VEKRAHVDILIIDDMENVSKRFKTMIPDTIKAEEALDAQTATSLCRTRIYRIVLVDIDIPNVNTPSLVRQLRALQPTAAFVALVLKNTKEPLQVAKEQGLDNILLKPFNGDQIKDFLAVHFESSAPVERVENSLRIAPCVTSRGKEDRYFSQVITLVNEAIEAIATACYPSVIVDLTHVPRVPSSVVQMVIKIAEYAKEFDIELHVVTPPDIRSALTGLVETAQIPMYPTIADAEAGTNCSNPGKKA